MIKTATYKKWIPYVILSGFALLLMAAIHPQNGLYGSDVDWLSQHSVFPEYFRQLFYSTHNLLPDFALEYGGGQNIYYLAYYGLLSPFILLSYLFPSVAMTDYLTVISAVILVASVCLFYSWLRGLGYSGMVSFTSAVLFLCATPLTFHSHRHLMFMNYMPFLLLALIGVDRYLAKGQKALLALSIFLCIMASYFFSVGCIAAVGLYALCRIYRDQERLFSVKTLKRLLPILGCVLTAVLMAGVLLLPTAYVVLQGRGSGSAPSFQSLFSLRPSLDWILYNTYGLGLTVFSLLALFFSWFSKKKEERLMGLFLTALLTVPLFVYLLNGTLYLRSKALIPFIPLYVLMAASLLSRIPLRLHPRTVSCVLMGIAVVVCVTANATESWATTAQVEALKIPEKTALLSDNQSEDFYRSDDLTAVNNTVNQTFGHLAARTTLYSSTSNPDYFHFYYDIMGNPKPTRNSLMCAASQNPFWQMFMGVRHLISDGKAPVGYREIDSLNGPVLLENQGVRPLAYASSNLISENDYGKLTFPYTLQPLFEGIVTGDGNRSPLSMTDSWLSAEKISLPEQTKHTWITHSGNRYEIEADEEVSLEVPLSRPLDGELLILRFDVSDQLNQRNLDTSVTVQGIKNKLSKQTATYPNKNYRFQYVISSGESIENLLFTFSKGHYEISGLEAFRMDYDKLYESSRGITPMQIKKGDAVGNRIAGDITLDEDGYLATTLPYDRGFSISVDGQPQAYEEVNTAFVGFPLKAGAHHIVIEYRAPGKTAGLLCSALGLLIFLLLCIRPSQKHRKSHRETAATASAEPQSSHNRSPLCS